MAEEIQIGPDEVDAVRLFKALGSQWRVHPVSGARLGIEYAAIPATAGMMEIAMTPARFLDLQLMEGAALSVFAAR